MNIDYSPLLISLKTAVFSTVITFIFGISTAWYISNLKSKLKNLIDIILTLPIVLPPTVIGFILLYLFGKNSFIGNALNIFGIEIIFSWSATVIAAIVVSFPLMYKTSRGAFEQIDPNIVNAAKTLGIPGWKIFFKIVLPLASPGVTSGTILAFARGVGEFGATLLLAGNIPGKTQTMPLAIYFNMESGENNTALLWVIITFLISIISITLLNIKGNTKVV